MLRFNNRIEQMPPSGIRKFFDLVIDAKDIISLGVGEPDFVTPWHVRERVFYSLEQGRTSYTSNWGLMELRKETARYLKDRFAVSYTAERDHDYRGRERSCGYRPAHDPQRRRRGDPARAHLCVLQASGRACGRKGRGGEQSELQDNGR